jgi:hypothetical protein
MNTPAISTVRRKVVLLLVFMGVFVLTLYTFLHEAGHAAAGLFYGGSLYSFSVNFLNASAHVGIAGQFTAVQRSLINLAGAALPLVVWIIFLLAVPRRANPVLELLKTISSAGVLGSLLTWILTPFLYLSGAAPAGDDVTQFLNNSHIHPVLAAGAALAVFISGAVLFVQRSSGEAVGIEQVTRWLKNANGNEENLGANFTLAAMAAVLFLLVVAALEMHFFIN